MDVSNSNNTLLKETSEPLQDMNGLALIQDTSTAEEILPEVENHSATSINGLNGSETEHSPQKPVKHVRLPLARIKQIMKMDPDVQLVQQDAIFLVTKATEMFLELIARECGKQLTANKRKTVMRRDVDVAIESAPQLCFLDGALE